MSSKIQPTMNHSDYKILQGDCLNTLKSLDDCSVNMCVTSPPYFGLRDYGTTAQIGLEDTPELFTSKLVGVFREVKRVLKQDGTLWLNLGDSYAGSGKVPAGNLKDSGERHLEHITKPYTEDTLKPKDLIGIPWRVAFALQADGWYLRQDIIWSKPNPMPESVTDRCTKAHEYIFLLSKSRKYYFDNEAIKEPAHTTDKSNRNRDDTKLNNTPGRSRMAGLKTNHYTTKNKRSVWNVSTKPYKGAHFATFPADLIKPCILAGCPEGGTVLDPFGGSGTTAQVSLQNNRNAILCELNDDYIKLAEERIKKNTAQLQLL